jgi:hypothetical protein
VLGIDENKERVFEDSRNKFIKVVNIGAGIGGGFSDTQELQIMKYHEAINGPDGKLWKEEVVKEHKRMVNSRVFKPVKISKVPNGVKLIDMPWAIKRKTVGLFKEGYMAGDLKQIDGKHYDGTSISVPVTNAMTIRIALMIMLMQSGIAHIVDVKGAFLYGEFEDGEKIYIKILLGFKGFYLSNTVLLLKKTLY